MSLRMTLTAALGLALALPALADANPNGKRGESASEEAPLARVVYPVADLMVTMDCANWEAGDRLQLERLIKLIKGTVAPKSWKDQGGTGTLQYYPLGTSLVVNQSREVQGEIADLLAALRRLQDIEVAVEMRIVQLSPEMAARFRLKAGFEAGKKDGGAKFIAGPTFSQALGLDFASVAAKDQPVNAAVERAVFTGKELYPWFELFQTDRATNFTHAPKITMLNGQRAVVTIASYRTFVTEYKVVPAMNGVTVFPTSETIEVGLRNILVPIVSADRRSVQLEVDFRNTSLASEAVKLPIVSNTVPVGCQDTEFRGVDFEQKPRVETLAFKQTCVIPDGQTMAVSLGQIMVETRNESGPPVLSKIPYVNRLFRNVGWGRETREVFLFLTPRVIVNAESEPVFVNTLPPISRP